MRLEWDEPKRQLVLRERRLDFAHAGRVFDSPSFTVEDDRDNYGEVRYRTFGRLNREIVMVAWTPRGEARRIITMRRCTIDERRDYFDTLG